MGALIAIIIVVVILKMIKMPSSTISSSDSPRTRRRKVQNYIARQRRVSPLDFTSKGRKRRR